ncbi:MAG: hypothetical protein LBD12_04465, partial [Clostridiales Family XIII bacterium]|nr:hypothetical protein [Clostridiales Family XIII bacterium]
RYDFRAADGHKPYQEFTSLGLLGTTRYYYPNLVPSWNAQKRAPGFAADVDAEPVTTIIAAEQSWERYGETPRWDDMDSEWGYQLCFGMASVNDPLGAHDSVHDILSIDCLLAGSPPEGFGENEKKDKIGSKPENSSQSAKDNKGQSAKDNKGKNANGQEGISAGESSSPAITVPKSNVLEILDKPAQDSLKGTQLLQSGAVEIQGAAGAALQGDIPWEVFEISPQSTPLLLPPLDPKALALVLGALTLSFLLGCAAGFTRLF